MEEFCFNYTHLNFGKHISFRIFKQKFIVMFLIVILSPSFSTGLAVFEGGRVTCMGGVGHVVVKI